MTIALAAGAAGLVLSLLMALFRDHGWERFFRSYVNAFMVAVSLCLGSLFWIAVQHASRAGWSVALRRLAEGVCSNLRWIWVLFIPIALAMLLSDRTHLYHWAQSAAAETDELLRHKAPFLNKGFWLVRAAAYFTVWALLARLFCSASLAQDASGDLRLTHRMQWFAPLALVLYALTQSFAAIDWVMSLESHWFSTMFGVYFFAASTCGFFSLLILMAYFLQRSGRMLDEITLEHYQDMGKQLFAFGIVFWAYIAYSQYMLIWYGNLPEETMWYLPRQMGGWLAVSLLLLIGHFAGPFLFMLSKHPKRRPAVLVMAAGWMLLMHLVDIYWLVMPRVPAEAIETAPSYDALAAQVELGVVSVGYGPDPLDVTCLLGLLGLVAAGTARWLSRGTLVPEQDPRLGESLAFENV
jgi:hypothetical protein